MSLGTPSPSRRTPSPPPPVASPLPLLTNSDYRNVRRGSTYSSGGTTGSAGISHVGGTREVPSLPEGRSRGPLLIVFVLDLLLLLPLLLGSATPTTPVVSATRSVSLTTPVVPATRSASPTMPVVPLTGSASHPVASSVPSHSAAEVQSHHPAAEEVAHPAGR
ncbi:hypothetical protein Taro_042957 [Colocasia esculenta]|uniref:Uncharacterized protein n=1 Tax=Colocasia esculenta TaxID=4460 RepID=A0A843X3E7_COLES|nr:hypothetical protein [Colocasia esculenta]